jgi:hypothetical protein
MNKYLLKFGITRLDKELSILRNLSGRVYSLEERWQLLEQV